MLCVVDSGEPGCTPAWRKSRRSAGNGACCEVAACTCGRPRVLVRDSELAASPVLAFGSETWAEFTSAVKRLEAEALPSPPGFLKYPAPPGEIVPRGTAGNARAPAARKGRNTAYPP